HRWGGEDLTDAPRVCVFRRLDLDVEGEVARHGPRPGDGERRQQRGEDEDEADTHGPVLLVSGGEGEPAVGVDGDVGAEPDAELSGRALVERGRERLSVDATLAERLRQRGRRDGTGRQAQAETGGDLARGGRLELASGGCGLHARRRAEPLV